MKLWTKPLGPLQTNGYVLDNGQGQGIIIDPGMYPQEMLEHISNLNIAAILLTHTHFDHIGGLEEIRKVTKAPVYLHPLEVDWLTDPEKNGSARWPMVTGPITCEPAEKQVQHGDKLELAGLHIHVLHTPGHSPGSVAYYLADQNMVIAGDALFAGSIGRTDLPGGDYDTLINSIKAQLFTLPDETIVYPGHGPHTTVGEEKKYNPFLRGS